MSNVDVEACIDGGWIVKVVWDDLLTVILICEISLMASRVEFWMKAGAHNC